MDNDFNNIDDLLDGQINNTLKKLQLLFPSTASDFKRVIDLTNEQKLKQPEGLTDPFGFLIGKQFKRAVSIVSFESQEGYSNDLAQAAREGKIISDDIKQKMIEDKLKSTQQKKDKD